MLQADKEGQWRRRERREMVGVCGARTTNAAPGRTDRAGAPVILLTRHPSRLADSLQHLASALSICSSGPTGSILTVVKGDLAGRLTCRPRRLGSRPHLRPRQRLSKTYRVWRSDPYSGAAFRRPVSLLKWGSNAERPCLLQARRRSRVGVCRAAPRRTGGPFGSPRSRLPPPPPRSRGRVVGRLAMN
jgi:hypothetical protein